MTRPAHGLVGTTVGLALVVALAIAALAAEGLAWGAGLVGNHLVVLIDTTGSPSNQIIDNASFTATFYDGNGTRLGMLEVAVLDERLRELTAGHRYKVHFEHQYQQAKRVSAGKLLIVGRGAGGKADASVSEVAPSVSVDTASAIVIPPPPVAATPQARCKTYADRAIAQNATNAANSCGLSGTRWSGDFEFHAQWCLSVRPADADGETAMRQDLLGKCLRRKIMMQRQRS